MLFIGNCKRGRRVKLTDKNANKINYTYGFDINNRLVTVKSCSEGIIQKEFIIWTKQKSFGISFRNVLLTEEPMEWIISTSECEYDEDDRISTYSFYEHFGFSNDDDCETDSCRREVYTYSEKELVVDYYEYYIKFEFFRGHKLTFQLDDGYLGEYTLVNFDGNGNIHSKPYPHIYKTYIKRKV